MTTKRLLITLACAGIAIVAVAALPLIAVVWSSLSPDTMSWDNKSAFLKCDGAIARNDWPADAALACSAMNLCANEATLSAPQMTALRAAAMLTPGCGDF